MAATKASPATKKPVKRTATKTPAKKAVVGAASGADTKHEVQATEATKDPAKAMAKWLRGT